MLSVLNISILINNFSERICDYRLHHCTHLRGTHTTEKYLPSVKKYRKEKLSNLKIPTGLLHEVTRYEMTHF